VPSTALQHILARILVRKVKQLAQRISKGVNMPWMRESEAARIKEKRELDREGIREREEVTRQQNSNEEDESQLPKKIPEPSYESTYEMRQRRDGDEEPPCTAVWPPPPQPIKEPAKTQSQLARETEGGRYLPRPRMPDTMPDPFFNPLFGPRVRVDRIAVQQSKGICSGCRRGRPDRNGTCTGMCSSWWPGEY
jgi:hypothetical protein